jgi:dephospho-CoA kinase
MTRLAVTGGIGSGKSLVCRIFSALGVPVYPADLQARTLMEENEQIRKELISLLGPEIYSGKVLNRRMMADLIFMQPALLEAVNGIVHPRVADDFKNWCVENKDEKLLVQESAILFESGAYRHFDIILVVTAPVEVRIRRVLEREGMTSEKIQQIMKNQLPEEEKTVRSHIILNNDGDHLILPSVLKILEDISI